MIFALHGMCSLYNNIVSDIRLAKETGYQGVWHLFQSMIVREDLNFFKSGIDLHLG